MDKPRLRARRWALATLAMIGVAIGVAATLDASWPGSALLAAALILPLLLPLNGLLQGDRRTYAWATLCIAPCFVYGISEVIVYLRVTRPKTGSQAAPIP
jgi:uncharacterized membrane protein